MKKVPDYKIVTPHAAAIIWNYTDRIGSNGASGDVNKVEKKIISTLSLLSIKTSKSKSNPAGSFELALAPTKNWVSFLTPGSWLCILMSQDEITENDFKRADASKVKFFGRIDHVRVDVQVDQETAARKTVYSVSGSDWGQVFNTTLYIDPVARETAIPGDKGSEIGTANRMIYAKYLDDMVKVSKGIPTTTVNVKALIDLWGSTTAYFKNIKNTANNNYALAKPQINTNEVLIKPDAAFQLPSDVFNYFNFKGGVAGSSKVADLLNYETGVLNGYDSYKDITDSIGIIKPDSVFGTHTMWQVLNDNCNSVLNEMLTDIRWDKAGRPALTLYKRIKPFCVNPTSVITTDSNGKQAKSFVKDLISKYSDIRRIKIPTENILSFSAGTNWRDKYNYCEIQIDKQLAKDVNSAQIKFDSAIFSEKVFSREGFNPMIVPVKYLAPTSIQGYNVFDTTHWKYLLKEWYFNTHNTLNGSATFIGINDYIQVGDNIIVDASVMGKSNNTNLDNINNPDSSYILCHVEAVNNSFSVNPETGARSYFTTVSFVRGIITDANGRQFNDGHIEVNTSKIGNEARHNKDNIFATSSSMDSDPEKVDGK